MNPKVNDIVDRFGVNAPDNVKLLVMGTVKGGGTGCMCGANALLRVLIQHMLIQRGEILVMDMVAGLEHLGRGTARRMDAMLVVIEPRMKSIDTVKRILKMAEEIEVKTSSMFVDGAPQVFPRQRYIVALPSRGNCRSVKGANDEIATT